MTEKLLHNAAKDTTLEHTQLKQQREVKQEKDTKEVIEITRVSQDVLMLDRLI